ncbi:unnamed protein product [Rotaria sordida]|uniref:MPN domain-containing protein n=1 Tax=Rotaria sordida TaxID=392033 RepID=A0A814CXL2_9BILA|nr:unnamed protein product [Rotaria sordida]CAF0990960.1 unnamed protein product [Rotaria sordida]
MSLSEEANKFSRDKVQWLLENQCRIPVRSTTPISYYYKTADNLIEQADHYFTTNQFEQSFILYSRYITLFVEELKQHHRDYPNVSINDRERVKDIIRTKALPRAEELKDKLKEKYIREYEEKQKTIDEDEEDNLKITATTLSCAPINIQHKNKLTSQQLTDNYVQLPLTHIASSLLSTTNHNFGQMSNKPDKTTYDYSQETATNSINPNKMLYRQISIPNDITLKFLQVAEQNTAKNVYTYGILAGNKKENNEYMITHIVIPKQNGGINSCYMEKQEEEEMFEYISNNNLITLGWIHTHPNERVFLSSIDLHRHILYQMLIQEAIAIVISPKFNQTEIFSMTDDRGIPVISACQMSDIHQHVNHPPLYVISSHTNYDLGLECKIIDLRH